MNEKYHVGRLLGRGGFGATYLGWDVNLQVRVAIKEFFPRQLAARDPNSTAIYPYSGTSDDYSAGLEQFLAEARTLAKFRDEPGIIPVLDYFAGNGTAYMVLKYEDGMTLEQYLAASGPIAPATALQLLVPVADALRVCHAEGLIHRDISPDNIFLTRDHRVKLFDFGASRFALSSGGDNLSVILKEGFAPFEQYQRNGRQGPWTDVYALTATLYRLLTGGLPPSAPDRIGGTILPALAARGVAVPARLENLLERGMALAPERRFQTIDDFLTEAIGVLGELSGGAPDPGATVSSANQNDQAGQKRRWMVIGGGVAAAMAVAMIVLVVTRPMHGTPSQASGAAALYTADPASAAPRPSGPVPAPVQALPTDDNTVDLAGANLRQAIQDQLVLQKNMVRLSAARSALQQMGPSAGADDPTAEARQMEQSQIESASGEIDDYMPRYIEDLRMLAGLQASAVTAAIAAEQSNFQAASLDPTSAPGAQAAAQAISLIQSEMSGAANGTLTPGQISSDLATTAKE